MKNCFGRLCAETYEDLHAVAPEDELGILSFECERGARRGSVEGRREASR